jgi:hypothetical protein
MKNLRALAAQVVALQAKARALGIFTNDRELLTCLKCGLQEDVTFSGYLITSHADSVGEDSGLRFEQLAQGRFRCPACGATVREVDSTIVPVVRKTRKGKRPPTTASR